MGAGREREREADEVRRAGPRGDRAPAPCAQCGDTACRVCRVSGLCPGGECVGAVCRSSHSRTAHFRSADSISCGPELRVVASLDSISGGLELRYWAVSNLSCRNLLPSGSVSGAVCRPVHSFAGRSRCGVYPATSNLPPSGAGHTCALHVSMRFQACACLPTHSAARLVRAVGRHAHAVATWKEDLSVPAKEGLSLPSEGRFVCAVVQNDHGGRCADGCAHYGITCGNSCGATGHHRPRNVTWSTSSS